MRRRQYAPQLAQDTSVLSSKKLLQTRPFQPERNNNQPAPQLQEEAEALTGGFDLTKIQYNSSPPPVSLLGQTLQAKLTIGEPNDKYEQEADRVAHNVVQRIHETGNVHDEYHPLGQLGKHADAVRRKAIMQRETMPDEEDTLQMKSLVQRKATEDGTASTEVEKEVNSAHHANLTQLQTSPAPVDNHTGMPDQLKSGLEQLSGLDLSGVRVHYNSTKPAQINAHAYAQNQDIHLGSGQEKHLPHEGWHVVQQMQGRVKPTIQAKGIACNDDRALEREADLMGIKAASTPLFDNRQEAIVQRNSQAREINSSQVTQYRRLQAVSHRGLYREQAAPLQAKVNNLVDQKPRINQIAAKGFNSAQLNSPGVIQCKPKNITKSHKLKLNKSGEIQNPEAGRVDPPVSYPMNTLIALHLINHDDLKGGHLFKREYGGADNYSNVVTWSERSEDAYTVFEEDYLTKARQGAIDADKAVTYTINTAATFGNESVTKDALFASDPAPPVGKAADTARHDVWSLTKLALETVPTSVDASLSDLPNAKSFNRTGSKMLDASVTPSATAAQTQVHNIVNGIADPRLARALERLRNP